MTRTIWACVLAAMALVACSSGAPTDGLPSEHGQGGGDGKGFGGATAEAPAPVSGDLAACATSSAKGAFMPVDLVILVDQSDSMFNNYATRWQPATNALSQFFGDAASQGIEASLGFFPIGATDSQFFCSSSTYASPQVAMRALPDKATFTPAIGTARAVKGTPTATALAGALTYAKTQHVSHPDHPTAVVLVTDGLPNSCGDTADQALARLVQVAALSASQVHTYVIGVGPALSNLDTIAQAGGTGKAILASLSSPQQTTADVQAALSTIRVESLSCDLVVPAPPDGSALDASNVNVVVTSADGKAQTLSYDKDCASGTGWHYDDPAAPKKVSLCASSCDAAKKNTASSITIAFGCATKGGVR